MRNSEGMESAGPAATNGVPTSSDANATTESLRRAFDSVPSPILAFVTPAGTGQAVTRRAEEQPVAADTSPRIAVLDGHVQARLGQRLRSLFDEVAREPVPERFLDLLDRLDQQEGR